MNKRFGKNDVIYLSFLAMVILVFLVLFYGRGLAKGDTVVITVNGQEYGRYSLLQEQEIAVFDGDGTVTNRIKIEDQTAKMIEADCPDGLCMHQRAISRDKENIVCLPNQVVVTIESSSGSDIDAVAN